MGSKGVYYTNKKNGDPSYRASLTYRNKHISLGSFENADEALKAYEEGKRILSDDSFSIEGFDRSYSLPFDKYVVLVNLRDNGIYCSNPLYIHDSYISYYLLPGEEMKFSVDDLFYYATHKIKRRGGHLYVNDYGMQVSLGSRYGIKNYAVVGRDYSFVNGDELDYRYENLEIINKYFGVEYIKGERKSGYRVKINLHGDLIVGYYDDAINAAIAYNKAVDILKKNGCSKDFPVNYIEGINGKSYADMYMRIRINKSIYGRRFAK